MTKPIVGM